MDMPIFELFSQRQRRLERGSEPDVYQYHQLPDTLRVQLTQIFAEAIGGYYVATGYPGEPSPNNNEAWDES
jgi:hypothetical protein